MVQDLFYAARILLRRPGFAIAAILSLALGIGVTTAIFTVVNAVALRPLPYADPDRLVWMTELLHGSTTDDLTLTPHFLEWRRQSKAFAALAGYQYQTRNLTGVDDAVELHTARVSASLLPMIGVMPAIGRNFTVQEDAKGHEHVAILTDALWRDRFGGDPKAAGRTILLDAVPYVVIGVMPRGFVFPGVEAVDLLTPLGKDEAAELAYTDGGFSAMRNVLGRLSPGVTMEQANAELMVINSRLPHPPWSVRITIDSYALKDHLYGNAKAASWILLAAAGFLLWIACANVSNLLLARLTARDRELAIRAVLGGSRGRLMAQLLVESALLSVVACGLGLAFAWALRAPILALSPHKLAGLDHLQFDGRVLAFAIASAILTVAFFGVLPALRATEIRLGEAVKSGEAAVVGGRGSVRILSTIAALEIATLLILSTGAGVMLKSFWKLRYENLGFTPDRLIAATLRLSGPRYADEQNRATLGGNVAHRSQFIDQLLERAQNLPGVEAAAITNSWEIPPGTWHATNIFTIQGRPAIPMASGQRPFARYQQSSPGLFALLQVPLLRGRLFDASDRFEVCVINRALADKYFRGENPIGQHLGFGATRSVFEIIGIVADVKTSGLDAAPEPAVYYPYGPTEAFTDVGVIVRSPLGESVIASELREAVSRIDPNQPVSSVETLNTRLSDSVSKPRFIAALLFAFAGLAVVLGIIGVYGVVACRVRWQMRELAVRQALGAQPRDVIGHVLRQGLGMIAMGIAAGLVGSLALSRVLSGMLYEVRANDPATLIGVTLMLSAVALAACWIPARRAARVDPLVLLRYE
jgi:putative ABC transport system permease protein